MFFQVTTAKWHGYLHGSASVDARRGAAVESCRHGISELIFTSSSLSGSSRRAPPARARAGTTSRVAPALSAPRRARRGTRAPWGESRHPRRTSRSCGGVRVNGEPPCGRGRDGRQSRRDEHGEVMSDATYLSDVGGCRGEGPRIPESPGARARFSKGRANSRTCRSVAQKISNLRRAPTRPENESGKKRSAFALSLLPPAELDSHAETARPSRPKGSSPV